MSGWKEEREREKKKNWPEHASAPMPLAARRVDKWWRVSCYSAARLHLATHQTNSCKSGGVSALAERGVRGQRTGGRCVFSQHQTPRGERNRRNAGAELRARWLDVVTSCFSTHTSSFFPPPSSHLLAVQVQACGGPPASGGAHMSAPLDTCTKKMSL